MIAQDVHFSMYNMSPLTLNPACNGVMDADFRVANTFRTQWKTLGDPLNSFAASYDRQFYALPPGISAGLVFVSDKSGGIALTENRILASIGIRNTSRKNLFSGGLQFGMGMKTFSLHDVTFPEQYSREIGQFTSALPSGESSLEWNTTYFDMNVGGLYRRTTNKGYLTAGVAVFHVNSPDDSFYKSGKGLDPRLVFHSDYEVRVSKLFLLKPSVLMMRLNKAQEVVGNAMVGIVLNDNNKYLRRIWFGVAVRSGFERNGDAFAPNVQFDFKHFKIGSSYDVTYSNLQLANDKRGAFEIALIYTSLNSAATKVMIPCDRY